MDFDCEPMILYKSNIQNINRNDPALIAKIANEWRVFALWSNTGEFGEIIKFNGMLLLEEQIEF